MKRYYLLLLLSGSFSLVMAQNENEAALALLDSISHRNFKATFAYATRSSQLELLESFAGGEIAVQGNKYRLTLPGQEVIGNGQTVWTYLKEANEVQITDHDPEQEAVTPWAIFANYRRDYTLCCFDTHQANGHVYDSVELLAKDAGNYLSRVRITVERATKHIECVQVTDSNQTLHSFFITYFEYDLKFDKAFFSFNIKAHKGVEVIDMR
jgi:outer membrane lipoprotein carrier protein